MTKISGPVALKTAAGHIHKSEVGGVVLSLESVEEALEVYAEMTARLGPEVTVATMAPDGVEVAFGAIAETPFGPAIMFGAGGALVEVLDDVTFELAPIDHTIARDML
ncbi:MAG TPA: CoA-binding protein, partial [Sneathiellales bacterium]|nr:CoA-binding protein [Sneathiellales bacterium]